MSLLLNWRLWAALTIACGLAFSHFKAYRSGIHHAQEVCAEERAKSERAAQEQAERNRDLMRKAEHKYVVQQAAQDRFQTVTVREVSHEAAPLADCPVPDALRVRFNEARACALGESAASCDPHDPMRKP